MEYSNYGTRNNSRDRYYSYGGAQTNSVQNYNTQRYQQPQAYRGGYHINENSLPPQYRPLGAWAYFGYGLLFSIPVVGLILLIVFSLNDDNINRRNFARSYFCMLALVLIVYVFFFLVLGLGFYL